MGSLFSFRDEQPRKRPQESRGCVARTQVEVAAMARYYVATRIAQLTTIARKGPIKHLVIDHVEKVPTEN
jgi:hypothetical protein